MDNFRLEDIGFYTLSDERALNTSSKAPLSRCELILTDRCTFKCPYCRGLREDLRGDIDYDEACRILDIWAKERLQNIRFTGGEPTLYPRLIDLVKRARGRRPAEFALISF